MRVLLDTCVLLWIAGEPRKLSPRARAQLTDENVEPCASAISAFEISLKHRKGKLELPLPPRKWFHETLKAYGIQELPITSEIAGLAPEVTTSHWDPCDRMLLATAEVHGIPLITPDRLLHGYDAVEIVW